MTDIVSSQEIIDKQASQLIAQAAEIERLREELAEYSEEFPLLQNDLGKALLDNERLRAALREIEETGKFAAQVPGPRNCLMEICETARAALESPQGCTAKPLEGK